MATTLLLALVAIGCGGANRDDVEADAGGNTDVIPADASTDAIDDTDSTRDSGPDGGADAFVPPEVDPAAFATWCGPTSDDVLVRVDAAIAELTLDEKAALMHGQLPLPVDNTWQTFGVERLGIEPYRMLDGPRGLSRFSARTGTAFPVAMARGATWDPALEAEVGRMIGAELRLAGADTLLAPTVNVLRHPRWGRAQETYGEDPHHIGVLGAAFVRGAQNHVMAVVKHYAANSIEDTRFEVDVQVDERTLHEVYLPHFHAIVREAGVAGVMSAYNQVNGAWSSESVPLLHEVLRGEWGFQGFVVSDWIWGTHDTIPAIDAGLDIEMPNAAVYGPALVEAVEAGEVDEARVDAAVHRILRTRWCFEATTRAPTIDTIESDAALALAEEVAARGMVLLENRDDALPIAPTATVALVGTLADEENTGDRGSSHVNSTDVVTPLEGLREVFGDRLVHVPGPLDDDTSREAVAAADVVVAVIGYSEDEEGEGQIAAGDREALTLPDDDLAIVRRAAEANDRVVVVVVAGSAFAIGSERDDVEALVVAWYAGARSGGALASLLTGERDFTGRLPVVFAASDDDLPEFDNTSLQVTYDGLHGYRHLAANDTTPLYPFGYGTSYATFAWTEASVDLDGDTIVATVRIENTGGIASTETVQVYAAAPGEAVQQAPLDLRGFAQVTLSPGSSETVEVRVPVRTLAHRDVASGGWRVEPGAWRIQVARSAAEVEFERAVDLEGGPVTR